MARDDLNQFIGKKSEDLEKAFGFDYYLEVKDNTILTKDQKHEDVVEAFFKFVKGKIVVVRTDDGIIKGFFYMKNDEIKTNLLLLGEDKGRFYDEDIEISYAFLGKDFFAYLLPSMLMFSANEENTGKMARFLDEYKLKYFEPHKIGTEVEVGTVKLVKLGRNEPCHCGSGRKYKKCCLNKDIMETGKARKVPI